MEYQKILKKIKEKMLNLSKAQKALLVLLSVLILALVIFIINPKKKLIEYRNSQRRTDVANILNAVYKYAQDGGDVSYLTTDPIMICKQNAISCEGLVDLSDVTSKEKKTLSEIPNDPSSRDPNASGYQIWKSVSGRINVAAPLAENKAVITLSK